MRPPDVKTKGISKGISWNRKQQPQSVNNLGWRCEGKGMQDSRLISKVRGGPGAPPPPVLLLWATGLLFYMCALPSRPMGLACPLLQTPAQGDFVPPSLLPPRAPARGLGGWIGSAQLRRRPGHAVTKQNTAPSCCQRSGLSPPPQC